MRFSIVTPVLNGESFINETILSVVTQSGPFSIRYHVQDGGSTDSTIKLLTAWQNRLANDFPIGCAEIKFSFSSERDRGLYDAINRGFSVCDAADVMTWINADDRFEPGGFTTVSNIMKSNPDIDWLTGRSTTINEAGECLYISPVTPLPRNAIAAGIFDGRFAVPFIQQEGTFWRPSLWKAVGGLNADFRLAGDFDLWRRFATKKDLVSVNAIFGCFRMRSGQLSADKVPYHAEIDASMSAAEKEIRVKASNLYKWHGFRYPVMIRHYGGPWVRECWPMSVLPFLGGPGFKLERWRLTAARLIGLADESGKNSGVTGNRKP
jgi:glycosyltransferase involved in cell wall biosynthesis